MKKTWKLFGIIALAAIIVLNMVACNNDIDEPGDPFDGEWTGIDSVVGNEAVSLFSRNVSGEISGGVWTMSWHDFRRLTPSVTHFAGTYTYINNTANLRGYGDEPWGTATVTGKNRMTVNPHALDLIFEFSK